MKEEEIGQAYALAMELALQEGAAPLKGKVWICEIDEHWKIAINGNRTMQEVDLGNGPITVPPFEMYVEFNGWVAGLVGPFEGVIAAGAAANEDAFITALEARLKRQ